MDCFQGQAEGTTSGWSHRNPAFFGHEISSVEAAPEEEPEEDSVFEWDYWVPNPLLKTPRYPSEGEQAVEKARVQLVSKNEWHTRV